MKGDLCRGRARPGGNYSTLSNSSNRGLSPSAEKYAGRLVPLFFAPDLDRHSGAMFNNKAAAVLPSPGLVEPHVSQFIAASESLAARAISP